MEGLRIGTCSWKYPSWSGLVYSSPEPANYLAEYAARYDTVEVDQWFWSLGTPGGRGPALPRKETVREYDEATPEAFRFTVKLPDALSLTHHRGRKGNPLVPNPHFFSPELYFGFLEALGPLLPKIGLLILQFEYLNRDKMPNRAAFFERLSAFLEALPQSPPLAVEIRNPRWMDSGWFSFLRDRGVAPVILQGYWMDQADEVLARHGKEAGPLLCLRLHGEDREGMEERTGERWDSVVRAKDGEISRILLSLLELIDGGKSAFLNVNNHYEGSAPLTIDKIRAILSAR